MTKPLPKINTSSLDDLFTTEEQRQDAKLEKVIKIPIDDIADFKKHPFNVRLDEEMESLIKSVEENGVLVPVLVRPNQKGNGYEMVSGHRRKFAMIKMVQLKLMQSFVTLMMTKQQSLWSILIFKEKIFFLLNEDLPIR